MFPNSYIHEQLVQQRRRELLQEAEQQRFVNASLRHARDEKARAAKNTGWFLVLWLAKLQRALSSDMIKKAPGL